MRSGVSRMAGRCRHEKLKPATGTSLFMKRCDICDSCFWTSWNKAQCQVCKRYVHKTCAVKRNQSVKDENTTRTEIDTKRGETARDDAAAGGRDCWGEPRHAATARAIADAGANLVVTGRTLERGVTTAARDEPWERRLSRYVGTARAVAEAGARLVTAGARALERDGATTTAEGDGPGEPRSSRPVCWARAVAEAGERLVATGRDMEHGEAMAARDETWERRWSRCVDAARAVAATGADLVATGEAMASGGKTAGPAAAAAADSPNDRRDRDLTRPRGWNGDGPPTKGSDGIPTSRPAFGRVTRHPPTGIPVRADPRTKTTPLPDRVVPGPQHGETTDVTTEPGQLHASTEFWRGNQPGKPIHGPNTCNPDRVRKNPKKWFKRQHNGVSPIVNNVPCQQNAPMKFWHGRETRGPLPGPPMCYPIDEGHRPTYNTPHVGPPLSSPPQMGPPIYNLPHMGVPIINPPHMGQPVFNPPYTGPPIFYPSHTGPTRFNPGRIDPPMRYVYVIPFK